MVSEAASVGGLFHCKENPPASRAHLRSPRSDGLCTSLGRPLVSPGFAGQVPAGPGRRRARQRCPPAVLFRRRSDETIFQSLRSRPEMITS
jgi:hypothetical protein